MNFFRERRVRCAVLQAFLPLGHNLIARLTRAYSQRFVQIKKGGPNRPDRPCYEIVGLEVEFERDLHEARIVCGGYESKGRGAESATRILELATEPMAAPPVQAASTQPSGTKIAVLK